MEAKSTYHFSYSLPGNRNRLHCTRTGSNVIDIWHKLKEELPEAFDIRLDYLVSLDSIEPLIKL